MLKFYLLLPRSDVDKLHSKFPTRENNHLCKHNLLILFWYLWLLMMFLVVVICIVVAAAVVVVALEKDLASAKELA